MLDMLTRVRGARSRRGQWIVGFLSGPALLAAAVVACSGKTEQRPGSPPSPGPSSGTSGSEGIQNFSGATSTAGGGPSENGGAPTIEGGSTFEAGAPTAAGTGGTTPLGVGGEGGESSEILPNEYPFPAMCASPRPTEPPLLAIPSGCAPGCREVVAFDASRGCIDTDNGTLVTCSCGKQRYDTNDSEACLKTSDGRRWLVVRGNELELEPGNSAARPPATFDPAVWSKCSDLEWQGIQAYSSCAFTGCEQQIASHCSVLGSRAGEWTSSCEFQLQDSPAYDARGCLKASCETDDNCKPDERCVKGVGWVPQCTFDSNGACNCGSGWSAAFDPAVCVDVASAGPRGPWQRYRAEDGQRGVIWELLPDGTLFITTNGVVKETKVDAIDLAYLDRELNNYGIRAGAQNGFICPVSGSGVPGNITLEVAGKSYARDVSGCFQDLPLAITLRKYT